MRSPGWDCWNWALALFRDLGHDPFLLGDPPSLKGSWKLQVGIWLWVKSNGILCWGFRCTKPILEPPFWVGAPTILAPPFWGRCPPILVYFSGDWDVHWDDLDFDPWLFV